MEPRVVKGNPRLALRYYSPLILTLLIWAIFSIYIKAIGNLDCEKVFGYQLSYISLIVATYCFPILIFISSIWASSIGYKIVKYKSNPPVDIPVFKNTITTYNLRDKFKATALLLYPAFGIYALYLGHVAYTGVMNGRTVHEIYYESECKENA